MAHVAKYNRGALGHMLSHYDRSKDGLNSNIDQDRTHLNYNLANQQPMTQLDFIHKRLGEVKVQNRKDVNVLCDWVITAPKELPDNRTEEFFKNSYNFLEKRYGKENVISAYVHMDETTPHMHFAFIPVTFDKKKNRYKVSAKEVVTRSDLQRFHLDLQSFIDQSMGKGLQIINDATKDGNKTIKELKAESYKKDLEAIQNELKKANTSLEERYEVIAQVEKVHATVSSNVKENKTLTGKVKSVTMPIETYEACQSARIENVKLKRELNDQKQENAHLKVLANDYYNNKELKIENFQLQDENRRLQRRLNDRMKQDERLWKNHPDLAQEVALAEKKDAERTKRNGIREYVNRTEGKTKVQCKKRDIDIER